MKHYAGNGFKDFVLCLGYKGEVIKHYFLNYKLENHDLTVDLGTGATEIRDGAPGEDWTVTLADTGEGTMTGGRVKRVAKYLGQERFFLTYGDGVSDVPLGQLLSFHKGHGRLATLTGVRPPGRFGELNLEGQRVTTFLEKPLTTGGYINGGFFVCEPGFLDYLSADESCVLERAPLEALARDGQLMMFPHDGFWQCMDTYRDYQLLNSLWERGPAPWRTWE
jgi:glucose-1-phosphate cytidylyltransferase